MGKNPQDRRQRQARVLRVFRTVHRTTGALLFVFFFIVSVTGFLLGWKKNSGGTIMAPSYRGTTTDMKAWLPVDSLHAVAVRIFRDSVSSTRSAELDRIDIRPDRGMVKFVFVDGFWGLQLDMATGRLLTIERRRSDFIEKVHDGSILDYYFGIGSGALKLLYTTVMSLALLLFTVTGFWLWYGPKRMRRRAGS